MRTLKFLALLAMAALALGCAKEYAYKPVPVKDVSAYPNRSAALGARVGAEAFYEEAVLKELFGFNLKSAGVVPVQVVIENGGQNAIGLVSSARVLDADGNWWDMLPESVVRDRVGDYLGGVDGGAVAKKSMLYGVAGAVLGAAVGIVSGTNIGEAIGKGAAAGAAAGAAGEIIFGDEDPNRAAAARDFAGREMGRQTVPAGAMTHGFLYFPAEMKQPVKLRLPLRQGTELREKDQYGYDKVPSIQWMGETAAVELNL